MAARHIDAAKRDNFARKQIMAARHIDAVPRVEASSEFANSLSRILHHENDGKRISKRVHRPC